MAIPIIGAIAEAIKGVAGAGKDIIDELHTSQEEKDQAKLKFDQLAVDQQRLLMEDNQQFRQFLLQYEGAAKDMPPAIQIMRGAVRPVITFMVVLYLFILLAFPSHFSLSFETVPDQYWGLVEIVLGFWFGGRAVEKVISTWKTGNPS